MDGCNGEMSKSLTVNLASSRQTRYELCLIQCRRGIVSINLSQSGYVSNEAGNRHGGMCNTEGRPNGRVNMTNG